MAGKIAVLGSGRGSNLAAILQAIDGGLIAGRVSIAISDQPDAKILDIAKSAGIPSIVSLPKLADEKRRDYDARLAEVLRQENADVIVLAGFMRILSKQFVEEFAGKLINIHPSLLPAFRGARAVQQTIDAGAKIAGCTTHLVTAELDGGPTLLQAAIAVRPNESADELAARILRLEHHVLPRTIALFLAGNIVIADGKAQIIGADSWLKIKGLSLVSGAIYGEGF